MGIAARTVLPRPK